MPQKLTNENVKKIYDINLTIFLPYVKKSHEISTLMVYTNPVYLSNLGRVGEIALCQCSRPDVAGRLAGYQRSAKVYPALVSRDRHLTWNRILCKGYCPTNLLMYCDILVELHVIEY